MKTVDYILLIMMLFDIIMGLIVAFFGKSAKGSGWFNSQKFREGICKKAGMLFYVVVAGALDYLLKTDVLHISVATLLVVNEATSIIENGALMGIPLPKKLKNALEVLRNESEENKND